MILYFSATGNTRYIAEELSRQLGDLALNLLERIRQKDFTPIDSEKPFVICSPVYVCEMPRFFSSYLSKVQLTGSRDVYFVFTSGGYTGVSSFLAKSISRRKHMNCKGCAELKMPRNYIANNSYPELETDEIEKRIRDCRDRIPSVADAIRKGEKLKSRHVWLFEILITLPFNPWWCHHRQGTRDFRITDRCISCGKCEKLCPAGIIHRDENGKPVWEGTRCAHCMSCIQNCPAGAIEYGQITQKKKRYRFDRYRYSIKSG